MKGAKYVHHDDDPEENHGHVEHIGSLWSVAKGQDETREQDSGVNPLEDCSQDISDVSKQVFTSERSGQNSEDEVEVTNSEPSENHANSLIDEFDSKGDLDRKSVV